MTAARLISFVVALHGLVVLGAFAVYGLGSSWLLLLDAEQGRAALWQTLYMAVATEVVALGLIWRRLERVRYTLRALTLGSRAFELDELAELSRVPAYVALVTSAAAVVAALTTLPPFVRAESIDLVAGGGLVLLAALVVVAAGLPLYALVRGAVSRALEQAPPDAAGEALEMLERAGVPQQRTRMHMVAAVVMPLSFVAMGAALLAHAHVRAAASAAQLDTAIALARGVGEDLPGAVPDAGVREALRRAGAQGFTVRLRGAAAPYEVQREEDGTMAVTVPLSGGHGWVEFAGGSGAGVVPLAILASVAFLVLALWGGLWLGEALAGDLLGAARQVRALGNENVLRGEARIARPARFRVVAGLGRAMEALAERFRVFAAAQERAIEAREAALRLRGLLFASVSHDLKSPLNAVLGFCALASAEPMNEAQQESLLIVEQRGRELLALLETILDAARAEAQQLTLNRAPVPISEVVARAVAKADDLAPLGTVEVEIEPDLPPARWDDARMAQALAALLGHAKRLSPAGGVRVEVASDERDVVELLVYEPSGKFPVGEAARLLDSANTATVPRRLGGLALGLGLARSLVRLHGGVLDVHEADGGGVVFRLRVPLGSS